MVHKSQGQLVDLGGHRPSIKLCGRQWVAEWSVPHIVAHLKSTLVHRIMKPAKEGMSEELGDIDSKVPPPSVQTVSHVVICMSIVHQGWLKSTKKSYLNTGSFPRNLIWIWGVLKKTYLHTENLISAYRKFYICILSKFTHFGCFLWLMIWLCLSFMVFDGFWCGFGGC